MSTYHIQLSVSLYFHEGQNWYDLILNMLLICMLHYTLGSSFYYSMQQSYRTIIFIITLLAWQIHNINHANVEETSHSMILRSDYIAWTTQLPDNKKLKSDIDIDILEEY